MEDAAQDLRRCASRGWCFGARSALGHCWVSAVQHQILGQYHADAVHGESGALDVMRAGQGVRHGNRLDSQFVISNVEERAPGCKVEAWMA